MNAIGLSEYIDIKITPMIQKIDDGIDMNASLYRQFTKRFIRIKN